MEFPTKQDDEIDETVKNKRQWDCIDNGLMQQYIKKLKVPGQAFCTLCTKTLLYQSVRKRDLQRQMTSPNHLSAMKTVVELQFGW